MNDAGEVEYLGVKLASLRERGELCRECRCIGLELSCYERIVVRLLWIECGGNLWLGAVTRGR